MVLGVAKCRLVVVLRVIRACSPRRCPRSRRRCRRRRGRGGGGGGHGELGEPGTFLGGQQAHTGPGDGPGGGSGGGSSGEYPRAAGQRVAPGGPSSSAGGGGGGRGPGSRAWVESCHTCGRELGASSTTSANPASEEGIKGEGMRRGQRLNSLPHSSSGRRVRSFAAGIGHRARTCTRAESRPSAYSPQSCCARAQSCASISRALSRSTRTRVSGRKRRGDRRVNDWTATTTFTRENCKSR